MNSVLESIYLSKELHAALLEPICIKYHLTLTEVVILMFLAEHESDTARDIVEKLRIAKSYVSTSLKNLEKQGYLSGSYEGGNRRTIHLHICEGAKEIIEESRLAQKKIQAIMSAGFTEEEQENFRSYLQRITDNISSYLTKPPCAP